MMAACGDYLPFFSGSVEVGTHDSRQDEGILVMFCAPSGTIAVRLQCGLVLGRVRIAPLTIKSQGLFER